MKLLERNRRLRWLMALLWMLCSLAGAQTPRDGLVESIKAVDFPSRSVGLVSNGDWLLHSNGFIETSQFVVPHDSSPALSYSLDITAYGSPSGSSTSAFSWPLMQVFVDGVWIGSQHITSASPRLWRLPLNNVKAGLHRLTIAFVNDAQVGTEDRNLYLRKAELRMNAAPALNGSAGTFNLQSVSLLNGFFPSNELHYGISEPCDASLSGCRNLAFIKKLGATDVTLTSVCTLQEGANWCAPQINYNNEEAALRVAIRHARALGLTVSLKPFVLAPNGEVLATYLAPQTNQKWLPSNPYEFYASVENNLVRHAQIAREEGVSLLMIGAEFGGRFTSGQPKGGYGQWCPRWTEMISKVRAAAAAVTQLPVGSPSSLALTYSATFAGFWNDIDANEAPYVCFWDQLDYFGFNAYPHMNLVPSQPAAAQLQSAFNVHKRLFVPDNPNGSRTDDLVIADDSEINGEAFNFEPALPGLEALDLRNTAPGSYQSRYNTRQYSTKWAVDFVIDGLNNKFAASLRAQNRPPMKAIITELGAPSSKLVHGFWGDSSWETRASAPDALYLDEQARALDGFLRAFYGDPRIVGISLWGLMPNHDSSYGPVEGWDLSHDFNGKPKAAEAVCQWFKRGWRSSGGACMAP